MKPKPTKTGILAFDFDGTIIDSTTAGFAKVQSILKIMGSPPVDEEIVRTCWGMPFRQVVMNICTAAGHPERVDEFIAIEHAMDDMLKMDSRLPWVLAELNKYHHLALITSRSKASFQKILSQLKFDPCVFFSFIQTMEDYPYVKPDHRVFVPLINWATENECGIADITYFGDTTSHDLAAVSGHKGMKFIGIVSGATKAHEFLSAGVSDLVHGVSGLAEYLEEHFLLYSKDQKITAIL